MGGARLRSSRVRAMVRTSSVGVPRVVGVFCGVVFWVVRVDCILQCDRAGHGYLLLQVWDVACGDCVFDVTD